MRPKTWEEYARIYKGFSLLFGCAAFGSLVVAGYFLFNNGSAGPGLEGVALFGLLSLLEASQANRARKHAALGDPEPRDWYDWMRKR
jgi:hypothetical protein